MERVQKALKLPNKQFKRNIGTTKSVFQRMQHVLQVAYDTLHERAKNFVAKISPFAVSNGT
jgi:hypothetical protein